MIRVRVPSKQSLRLIRSVSCLISVFCAATLWLLFLNSFAYPQRRIFIPSNMDELKLVLLLLEGYSKYHPKFTILFFSSIYLYQRTFALPGNLALNIISGILFGEEKGFVISTFLSAFGSYLCFLLSKVIGGPILFAVIPNWLELSILSFKQKAEDAEYQKEVFKLLLLLRWCPLTPGSFIDFLAPHCGVCHSSFFWTTLFGTIPHTLVAVHLIWIRSVI